MENIDFRSLKDIISTLTDYLKDLIEILKAFIASWKQVPAGALEEEEFVG